MKVVIPYLLWMCYHTHTEVCKYTCTHENTYTPPSNWGTMFLKCTAMAKGSML